MWGISYVFLAIYLLRNEVDTKVIANILEELGYRVVVFDDRIEAYRDVRSIRIRVNGRELRIQTNDYGPICLNDLKVLEKEFSRRGLGPRMLIIKSPYIIALEEDKDATKELFKGKKIRLKREYVGYCG